MKWKRKIKNYDTSKLLFIIYKKPDFIVDISCFSSVLLITTELLLKRCFKKNYTLSSNE